MQTGQFKLHENGFIAGNRKLVIRQRKQPSEKPENYLIQLSPFQYISSLFPVPEASGTYTFDFEKKLYSLRKEGNLVEIEELS